MVQRYVKSAWMQLSAKREALNKIRGKKNGNKIENCRISIGASVSLAG